MSVFKKWARNVVDTVKGEAQESVREDMKMDLDLVGDICGLALVGLVAGLAIHSARKPATIMAEPVRVYSPPPMPPQPVVQIYLGKEGVSIT